MASWHDDRLFWKEMAPFLFTEKRMVAAESEAENIVRLSGVGPGSRVLDMPCGIGRHSHFLAAMGYRVKGVDRSDAYIEQAREHAEELGLSIEFEEGDMRSFAPQGGFDLVINMYTSFGYFSPEENLKAAQNFRRALDKNGILIMEMMGREVLARIFQERGWTELDGKFLLEEREILDEWTRIKNRWILITPERSLEYTVDHYIYSPADLRSILMEAGFSDAEFFGGLDGRPYDNEAQRLIALARA